MNKSDLIALRGAHKDDLSFIYSTWLRGLYYGDSVFSEMEKTAFMKVYHSVITSILNLVGSKVIVACLKEDPEIILGYAVVSGDEKVLHWVFVKKSWRGIGIAKSLVPSTVQYVTHLTKVALGIIRKSNKFKFNPFLLGGENHGQ